MRESQHRIREPRVDQAPSLTEDLVFDLLQNDQGGQSLVRGLYWDLNVLTAAERFHASEEYLTVRRLLRQWLPHRALRVLDLGAGRGIATYALAGDGHDVTAVEPSASSRVGRAAIQELGRRSKVEIRIVAATGEHLPVRARSMDLVYVRQALHHATNLREAARQTYGALRPGGFLLATREHVLSHREHLSRFLEGHPTHRYLQNENAYTVAEYLQAIREAGFYIRRVWAPIETVVNFYPGTEADREALVERIPKHTWRGLGRAFYRLSWFRDYALRRAIRLDETPGRLYSFLAERPPADAAGEAVLGQRS